MATLLLNTWYKYRAGKKHWRKVTMIKNILIIAIAIIFTCVLIVTYVYHQATKIPDNNAATISLSAIDSSKKIVVFMGDSITHGAVSYDYVRALSLDPDLQNYIFVNEGINSQLVYNLSKKINRVINIKPHYIYILIGTNDLRANLSDEEFKRFDALWKLPVKPTEAWFEDNYKKLIDILKEKTAAHITLISIPPLGENLDSLPFKKAIEYSQLIKNIARLKKVGYIGFNEVLTDQIVTRGKKDISAYKLDKWYMYMAILSKYMFLNDWDNISDDRGLLFLTDNLHLNGWGGKILVSKIKENLISKD
jgi:lysophospholipase L1-like esterase